MLLRELMLSESDEGEEESQQGDREICEMGDPALWGGGKGSLVLLPFKNQDF